MMVVQEVALMAPTRVTTTEMARARRINWILCVAFKEFEGARIHHRSCLPASHHVKMMLRRKLLKSIRKRY
jgi:hypothetical protein